MELTPGLRFILRGLIKLSLPSVSFLAVNYALDRSFGLALPPILKWSLACLAGPLVALSRTFLTTIKQNREMNALGARKAPTVPGKYPGNLDVLFHLINEFAVGYIGQPFWPMFDQLGPIFNLRVLGGDGYFTTEPEHIKQLLATEFHNYGKGEEFIDIASSVLGTGVFNSDGDMWKFHRTMTRPFFVRDRISHFDIFARHADVLISRIKATQTSFDAQDLFARFTIDAATEFLFGREYCVGALESPASLGSKEAKHGEKDGGHTADVFATAFADAQNAMVLRLRRGIIWPLWEIWRDCSKESMDIVHAYIEPIVEAALRKKHASLVMGRSPDEKIVADDSSEQDESLLDNLVAKTEDMSVLRDELINIMLAGRDTTASTLTFSVYLMALYPDAAKRLREEVLEKVGTSRNPTFDDIRDMRYLRAFINETLRLYPVVPFNGRMSINAATLAPCNPGDKPIYVPPKTQVTYSVFMMHRRADLWGPDAQEFDPNRFLDERVHKYLTPNPFIFLPFNAGPRICLGQQFAYNEVSFMLIRLLQSFDSFELDLAAQPIDSLAPGSWKMMPGRQAVEKLFPKAHLTMHLHKGMWVRMKEAIDD